MSLTTHGAGFLNGVPAAGPIGYRKYMSGWMSSSLCNGIIYSTSSQAHHYLPIFSFWRPDLFLAAIMKGSGQDNGNAGTFSLYSQNNVRRKLKVCKVQYQVVYRNTTLKGIKVNMLLVQNGFIHYCPMSYCPKPQAFLFQSQCWFNCQFGNSDR